MAACAAVRSARCNRRQRLIARVIAAAQHATFTEATLNTIERKLAQHVGPIAHHLVQSAARQAGSLDELRDTWRSGSNSRNSALVPELAADSQIRNHRAGAGTTGRARARDPCRTDRAHPGEARDGDRDVPRRILAATGDAYRTRSGSAGIPTQAAHVILPLSGSALTRS